MSLRNKVERPVSAGGVVYKIENQQIQILLCGQGDPSSWVLPKGTPDPDETMEETALREVQEETGIEVIIQSYVGKIRYWFSDDEKNVSFHKTVHFYLMIPIGGSISLHDHEFERVEWFPIQEALKSMTYDNDRQIIKKGLNIIKATPHP